MDVDVVDTTCVHEEADSTLAATEANVFLLDMSDVCCEVDVGNSAATPKDELIEIDIGKAQKVRTHATKLVNQAAPVRFFSVDEKGRHCFQDDWIDSMTDIGDRDPDSDDEYGSEHECEVCNLRNQAETKDSSTQVEDQGPLMSIKDFKGNPDAIKFYTGLESYDKFMLLFKQNLFPDCCELNYRHKKDETLSIVDQLFLTLMKLRRNTNDFELSLFFGISMESVTNIYETWIIFLSKRLTELLEWPPPESFDHNLSPEFKSQYPSVQYIIDCLEVPISKPDDNIAQQATQGNNHEFHSIKFLVVVTPWGWVSYCSDAFGGATTDDEVFELSGVLDQLDTGVSIIVDKRFNIDNLCKSKNVTVHAVNLKKNSGYKLSLLNDKCEKQFFPFKSLEYLLNSHQILQKLSVNLLPLASEVCCVCAMLNNIYS